MGKRSQSKGRRGEFGLAVKLREAGFNDVQPSPALNYGTCPDLVGLPGVHIECKYVERLNLHTAFEQAKHDAEKFQDGAPTVFHRRSRESWLVTMSIDDWIQMYKRANERR